MRPERFQRIRSVLERRQPDLTVLMDRVNKSHNFSAILRNCDAVGVLEAHVVPPETGLPLHHGTSAGTKKWVPVQTHPDASTAVRYLKALGMQVVAAHPSEAAQDYRDLDYTHPTAIVLGAELHGVSEDARRLADVHVCVPMMGMVRSLNVSVATAILLFEAFRQREAAGLYDSSRLPGPEFERRLFEWAYPAIAARRRRSGRPYPSVDDDGQILPDAL